MQGALRGFDRKGVSMSETITDVFGHTECTIDDNGNISDVFGRSLGSIDSSGHITDVFGGTIGNIDSNGHVSDVFGRTIGNAGDGRFTDVFGRNDKIIWNNDRSSYVGTSSGYRQTDRKKKKEPSELGGIALGVVMVIFTYWALWQGLVWLSSH